MYCSMACRAAPAVPAVRAATPRGPRISMPWRVARRRPKSSTPVAAAAASSVRSTSSSLCASDGNQASNCDGGGYTPWRSSARHQAPYACWSLVAACS